MIRQQTSPRNAVRPHGWDQRWRALAVCLVLAAMTFAVFGQTAGFGFVDYDDDKYVYETPVVARGLTRDGIIWAFRPPTTSNQQPMSWLSHILDSQLHGLHPGGRHFP